jgi:hypothetical protein
LARQPREPNEPNERVHQEHPAETKEFIAAHAKGIELVRNTVARVMGASRQQIFKGVPT